MVTQILESYFNHLEKLCDKAELFFTTKRFDSLPKEDKENAENKFHKLIKERSNVYDLLETAKKDLKESNYNLNFELKFRK